MFGKKKKLNGTEKQINKLKKQGFYFDNQQNPSTKPQTFSLKGVANVDEIYYAMDSDLGIKQRYGKNGKPMPSGHAVLLMSKDKKGNCEVKTITTIARNNKTNSIKQSSLDDIITGKVIPIPNRQLGSTHLCGVRQDSKVIKDSKLLVTTNKSLQFNTPKRYLKVLHANDKFK